MGAIIKLKFKLIINAIPIRCRISIRCIRVIRGRILIRIIRVIRGRIYFNS
jgi:hypothetical protein